MDPRIIRYIIQSDILRNKSFSLYPGPFVRRRYGREGEGRKEGKVILTRNHRGHGVVRASAFISY
jgi:hypothetical protein